MLSAIVVAAGKSTRFNGKSSKILSKINSKPVIFFSLFALNRHPDVGEIIVVANAENMKAIAEIVRKYKINKVKKIVLGGRERQDSVLNGLNSLSPKTGLVLIHDGARPFINSNIVSSVISTAKKFGAAIAGVPIKATVKKVSADLWVKETVDRNGLWEIQTPQVFSKEIILRAYKKLRGSKVTDEAMLVERIGAKVKLVLGSYINIKITNPEDLAIANAIARK